MVGKVIKEGGRDGCCFGTWFSARIGEALAQPVFPGCECHSACGQLWCSSLQLAAQGQLHLMPKSSKDPKRPGRSMLICSVRPQHGAAPCSVRCSKGEAGVAMQVIAAVPSYACCPAE